MRCYLNRILPVCLLLTTMPFMLGAVVLIDPSVEAEKYSIDVPSSIEMPRVHGPVLDLSTEPVILQQNPAVLDQPFDDEVTDKQRNNEDIQNSSGDKSLVGEESQIAAENKDKESKAEAKPESQKSAKKQTAPQPKLEPLSPEMEALRGRLRQAIDHYSRQPLNTKDNTTAHLLQACRAFGCDTLVRQGGASGDPVNGFTCLCWNYPCGGYNLLKMVDGHIAARVGYGLQSNPSEFLAVLALSRVPREYPIRAGKTVRTVADLVESEKLACRSGEEQAYRLIGLARYLPDGATWKNGLGETWSVERMLKQELDLAQQPAPCGGTHRLMAISYAVRRRAGRGLPIDGQYSRAKKYIDNYQDFALSLQNANGSWHPQFFKYRGEGGSTVDQLNSTGHIMAWLALSLPKEKLDDQRVVRGLEFLANTLTGRRMNSLTSTSAADIAARMNSLHALNVYNRRVFLPYDKAAQEAAAAEEEKTSTNETASAGAAIAR